MKAILAMPRDQQHLMFTRHQLEELGTLLDIDTEQTVPDLDSAPAG